jgi:hypothetical protein
MPHQSFDAIYQLLMCIGLGVRIRRLVSHRSGIVTPLGPHPEHLITFDDFWSIVSPPTTAVRPEATASGRLNSQVYLKCPIPCSHGICINLLM